MYAILTAVTRQVAFCWVFTDCTLSLPVRSMIRDIRQVFLIKTAVLLLIISEEA